MYSDLKRLKENIISYLEQKEQCGTSANMQGALSSISVEVDSFNIKSNSTVEVKYIIFIEDRDDLEADDNTMKSYTIESTVSINGNGQPTELSKRKILDTTGFENFLPPNI